MRYVFDWDPQKAQINIQKHREMGFDRATSIFRDPHILSLFDEEHSRDEERWVSLGIDSTGVLLIVIHTFEQVTSELVDIRLISARKANAEEIQIYQEGSL